MKPDVIGAHAECLDCGWICEDLNARKQARRHADRNKHRVSVDETRTHVYDFREYRI